MINQFQFLKETNTIQNICNSKLNYYHSNLNIKNMFRLEYHVNGRLYEIVLNSAPYAVCKWKSNNLKSSTHAIGKFKIVSL